MEIRVLNAVAEIGPTNTIKVIEHLGITDEGENEAARLAVWRLLDSGYLHLTRERQLVIVDGVP